MAGQPGPSTSAAIFRNDDLLSLALRRGNDLDMNDILNLDRFQSPVHDALSSLGTCSTTVFSNHEDSTITKPTTVDVGRPIKRVVNKGKQKAIADSPASLSGTHGSASEAEMERRESRRHDLLAVGTWVNDCSFTQHLKGGGRAKERAPWPSPPKEKKIEVILTQDHGPDHLRRGHLDQVVVSAVIEERQDRKAPQAPDFSLVNDSLLLAEEGRAHSAACQGEPTMAPSRRRFFSLIGLAGLMILTLIVAGTCSWYTGRARLAYTKGIVFAATTLLAVYIIIAMLVARQALLEALLAGLLEFVFGFALLTELDDFL